MRNISSSSKFGCTASLTIIVIFQIDNIFSTNAVLGIVLILRVGVSIVVALGCQFLCVDCTCKMKPDLVDAQCQPCGKLHPVPRMWPKYQETKWNMKPLHPDTLFWMTSLYCWVSCIWLILTDLDHCLLCRRTYRAFIWTVFRKVSCMLPEKMEAILPSGSMQIVVWKACLRDGFGEYIHDDSPDKRVNESLGYLSLYCKSKGNGFSVN